MPIAGADLQGGAGEAERQAQLLEQLGGDRLARPRAPSPGRSSQQQHELVAAVAGEQVPAATRCSSRAAICAQQLVAGRVAERVVDGLEVVEVEVEQRDGGARALGAIDGSLSRRSSRFARFARPGEPVVVGEVGELLLAAMALR